MFYKKTLSNNKVMLIMCPERFADDTYTQITEEEFNALHEQKIRERFEGHKKKGK